MAVEDRSRTTTIEAERAASDPAPRPLHEHDPEPEVIAFLAGRTVPCPRCGYDLRDIQTARCPECAEPLVLKIGTPRVRFGWLVLTMAPGCFSGVAAVLVLVPIVMVTLVQGRPPGAQHGTPWPIIGADLFGFLSAGSVALMYRHRHRMMAWPSLRQRWVAVWTWIIHVAALGVFILMMSFL